MPAAVAVAAATAVVVVVVVVVVVISVGWATKSEYFEGHAHLNSPKNYIRLLGVLLPIHSTRPRGAKGHVWGARRPFPPAAAMVGYGCDGCWRRMSGRPTVGIVEIVYGSIFFYSYVVPIHS